MQKIKDLIAQAGEPRIPHRRQSAHGRRGVQGRSRVLQEPEPRTNRRSRARAPGRACRPESPKASDDAEPWRFSYSWVELGKDERRTLGLSNASKGCRPELGESRRRREKGEPVVLLNDHVSSTDESKHGSTTSLVWSRKCENLQLRPARAMKSNSSISSCPQSRHARYGDHGQLSRRRQRQRHDRRQGGQFHVQRPRRTDFRRIDVQRTCRSANRRIACSRSWRSFWTGRWCRRRR